MDSDHVVERRLAVVTLLLLSPACGELLTGSTPLPRFLFTLTGLPYLVGFYGCGALLIREMVRRRGLGWPSIALLGAAYGVVEEGLVASSWFNPFFPGAVPLHGFGRFLDTNWLWAVQLTVFHAAVSITIPILVTETAFPAVAAQPWLSARGVGIAAAVFGALAVLSSILTSFVMFRAQGYTHPPATWFGAAVLVLALALGALRMRRSDPGAKRPGTPPRLWMLRVFGLSASALIIATTWGSRGRIPAPAAILAVLLIAAASVWCVREWSRRSGWGTEQALAVASGTLAFFAFLQPIAQGALIGSGVALVALSGMVWLARRVGRGVTLAA